MKSFSQAALAQAKKRYLEKCRGPRAVTPIEPNTVEAIIDQFLEELGAGEQPEAKPEIQAT